MVELERRQAAPVATHAALAPGLCNQNRLDLTPPPGNGLDSALATPVVATLLKNVADARVWAGLHYRFSTTAGVNIGTQVAQYDLKGNFQPTKK